METGEPFFIFKNQTELIIYNPFSDFDSLPFPLYLPSHWKYVLTILQVIALAVGLRLRLIIFKFLKSPESNGPLNRLIWMDQINGLFLGIVLIVKVVAFNCTVALSQLIGDPFCQFFDFVGSFHVAGSVVWTCFTAFFR